MFGITDLTTFVLGTIFIVLLPGPNSLFVLTVAVRRGTHQGFLGACGIFVGDSILIICTALGAASLLKTDVVLYNILRFGGAIYLSYIGVNLILGAWKKWWQPSRAQADQALSEPLAHTPEGQERPIEQDGAAPPPNPFNRALIISLLNPKAIFFFLAFFTQFIDPTYPYPALPYLVQTLIVQFFSALYLSGLIFFGYRLAQAFNVRYRLSAFLSGSVGALFCGYGVRLALTSSIH